MSYVIFFGICASTLDLISNKNFIVLCPAVSGISGGVGLPYPKMPVICKKEQMPLTVKSDRTYKCIVTKKQTSQRAQSVPAYKISIFGRLDFLHWQYFAQHQILRKK